MYTGFYDIVFTDENSGWIYGGGGGTLTHIFRTTNGGVGGLVSVEDNQSKFKINNYILEQNYPNPFNPNTTIKYQIPELSFTTIKVYDVLGNEVATLINEELSAGEYENEFDATDLTSGIYFYQLLTGEFIQTKKMVLLK
ncbi:MAG: T9SS type A sorting domain-containing protein [Ignavibacteria bacterium]|nr:T9SS type A sorting domain-containing protein [Ignavibacteria bacterium]MBT8392652.1 T9SS type A sorting domain-containing protein [Ignavibacteria bacterium]NNJ54221.1 T9SS type A sorting domain-containing protein [Ignavibacteriaceae bacterium]NNL21116.1 T9SS type A sorting domain-containing protein [Ignavibacteriaceae bacterium]